MEAQARKLALELGDKASTALGEAGFRDVTWDRDPAVVQEPVDWPGSTSGTEFYAQGVARVIVRPVNGLVYEIELTTSWVGGGDYTATALVSAQCCGRYVELLPVFFTAFGGPSKVPDPISEVVRLIGSRPDHECSQCSTVVVEEDGAPF